MLRTVLPALAVLTMGCSDYIIVKQPWVDRFTQAGTDAPADILFVVDNSASMAEEQGRLEENAGALLAVLRQIDIDFQLGVITTDASEDPELVGGVLPPDMDELDLRFQDALAVGFDGGRIEWGLQRARDAIVHNPDFLRSDSRLVVLALSDEDDQSPGAVTEHVTALTALANDVPVTVHALTGDLPAGCAAGETAASAGPRYAEAVSLTDGQLGSICADDYADELEAVGLQLAERDAVFAMSRLPQADTIDVVVDGARPHRRDVDGWRWSAARNAIIFDGWAVPEPGARITITYTVTAGEQSPKVEDPWAQADD